MIIQTIAHYEFLSVYKSIPTIFSEVLYLEKFIVAEVTFKFIRDGR